MLERAEVQVMNVRRRWLDIEASRTNFFHRASPKLGPSGRKSRDFALTHFPSALHLYIALLSL